MKKIQWSPIKEVTQILKKTNQTTIQELITVMLMNKNRSLQKDSANALLQIGKPAVKSLMERLMSKNDDAQKVADYQALVNIGSPAAQLIVQGLKNKNDTQREEIAKILLNMGVPAIWALMEADADIEKETTQILKRMDQSTIKSLINTMSNAYDTEGALRRMEELIKVLEKIGQPAVYPLIDKLQGPGYVPEFAAKALGVIRDKAALQPLIKVLLKHEYPSVRAAAAKSLGKIDSKAAAQSLKNALSDSQYTVREAAKLALSD